MRYFAKRLLCVVAGCLIAMAAGAQTWPTKPVRWVLPFPAGGPSDNISRAVTRHLSQRLGQPVVVENRPGANGAVGTALVARAVPDGYTIMLGTSGTHTINPHLYANLGYDAINDFLPITAINEYVGVLVVPPSSRIQSVADVIATAKANPGTLTFGSSGQGSTNHMVTEMFGAYSNVKLVHVPYKGDAPAMTDLLGGQISFMFTTIPFALQFERQGKLRLLATSGPKRHPSLPNVPTVNETVPGVESVNWLGLFAPAAFPREIAARIASEVAAILKEPDMQQVLTGVDAAATTPEVFGARVRAEYARWGEVVKKIGVKGQ